MEAALSLNPKVVREQDRAICKKLIALFYSF